MTNDAKNIISRRIIILCGLFVLAGVLIAIQLLNVQVVERDYWVELKDSSTRVDTIRGKRGNIYADKGQMLATSSAYYKLAFDPTVASNEVFNKNIKKLSIKLANKYKKKIPDYYIEKLIRARKEGNKYFQIDNRLAYNELKEMKTWPIFNLPKNEGGLIYSRYEDRTRPYEEMAKRTLGFVRENAEDIGLERAFDKYLQGDKMPVTQIKVSGNKWVDTQFTNEYPDDGADIYTSLDVNIQDRSHKALENALIKHNAHHGTVIVMETKTGAVKAMANLKKESDGTYRESFNYAVGESMCPGSTFKAASLLALISDNRASLNSMIDLENGLKRYYDRKMKDDHAPKENEVTLQRAFEISSNVGMSKMINEAYKNDPEEYVELLKFMGLNSKTGIEIPGERTPKISEPGESTWSGVSLPWLAIGYELEITPLQLLTFYNAIANEGRMMKPYLVKEVKKYDEQIETFDPVELKRICTPDDAYKLKKALRGVVLRGTAKNISSAYLTLAGKTGTALISPPGSEIKKYQASFAGFFPAEDPKYSCIIVVNDPKNGEIYGSQVAAPIFKQIAESCFAKDIDLQRNYIEIIDKNVFAGIPQVKTGYKNDLLKLFNYLDVPFEEDTKADLVYPESKETYVSLQTRTAFEESKNGQVPNVMEMGLRDAIFILENKGFKVKINGWGKVKKQSLKPGTNYNPGDKIDITLST